jgi:hypothetical protein
LQGKNTQANSSRVSVVLISSTLGITVYVLRLQGTNTQAYRTQALVAKNVFI